MGNVYAANYHHTTNKCQQHRLETLFFHNELWFLIIIPITLKTKDINQLTHTAAYKINTYHHTHTMERLKIFFLGCLSTILSVVMFVVGSYVALMVCVFYGSVILYLCFDYCVKLSTEDVRNWYALPCRVPVPVNENNITVLFSNYHFSNATVSNPIIFKWYHIAVLGFIFVVFFSICLSVTVNLACRHRRRRYTNMDVIPVNGIDNNTINITV